MLPKSVWRNFFVVTFSIAIVGIGLGCTLPLTALVLSSRGYGPNVIGWMVAASALGGVCGTFAMPSLVGRFGRRRIMFGCFILATASVMPLQYVESIELWMLLRFLFGVAMAALFLIGEAWINVFAGDAVRGRVVAIYTTSFTLFQVLGPLLTDWLIRSPHSAFLLCGSLFMLGVPGILLASDTRHADQSEQGTPQHGKEESTSWSGILRVAPVIIIGTAFFASFDSIILSFLPLVALDHGCNQSKALMAPALVLAGDASLQYAAGWLSDHYGRRRVHQICALAVCLMLPLLGLVIRLPGVWECYLFLLGGFAGAIYTLSMVESGAQFSGAALLRISGLIGLTWNISSSVGPAATGLIMQRFGSIAMVSVLWMMALVFFVISVWKVKLPTRVVS